jgi:hypothetical protein
LPAALCGWDILGVQFAGNLAQAAAGGVRGLDSFDDVIGELPRAALNLRSWASVGWLTMFGDESFEFVGRDESCAPGHLDRLHVWQDAPEKGGATDAERLGGLATGVGEPLDTRRLPDDWLELRSWT